jgi:hypothetical protein
MIKRHKTVSTAYGFCKDYQPPLPTKLIMLYDLHVIFLCNFQDGFWIIGTYMFLTFVYFSDTNTCLSHNRLLSWRGTICTPWYATHEIFSRRICKVLANNFFSLTKTFLLLWNVLIFFRMPFPVLIRYVLFSNFTVNVTLCKGKKIKQNNTS